MIYQILNFFQLLNLKKGKFKILNFPLTINTLKIKKRHQNSLRYPKQRL